MIEFVLSNGALIAALLSAIAALFAAWATYRAPLMAAEVSDRLKSNNEKENEKRRLRSVVFFTLMQERATMASPQSVQMLNAIDAVYYDCPAVREAWADLYHMLNNFSQTPPALVEEKHRELLRQMAIHLGLSNDLKRDDFSRMYYPTALAEEAYVTNLRRAAEKKQLELGQDAVANTAQLLSSTSPFPPRP